MDKTPPDYDLKALSKCFIGLSRHLLDSTVSKDLHSMLKPRMGWETFLSIYTVKEAIRAFSSGNTY